jgi:purine-cytosine permease-like protein
MFINMKIPFKFLEKYKYFYFAISSFVVAVLAVLLTELFLPETRDFSLKHLVHDFFFHWGFMYPVSFAAYEAARKQEAKK